MINLKTPNWIIEDIDTVLFDKDGTIQDLHVYWGEIIRMRSAALVDQCNLDSVFFEKICLWLGFSLKKNKLLQKGPVGIKSREEIIDDLLSVFLREGIGIKKDEIAKIFDEVHRKFLFKMDDYVKILPGVKNLIVKLKDKSVKIAIVTADTVDNAKKCMNLLGIDKYIDLYVGRDQSLLPKSSGEHARIALSLLGSSPGNTVCFGDAPMDLIMAEKSGLKTGIGVLYGQTPEKELLKYSKKILKSYDDLVVC